MHDDPFARAVHRAEAAEHARAEQVRHHRRGVVSKWTAAGFRIHFIIYVVISIMLVAIWATTSTAFPWPIFPILAWGAGVAAHWSITRELSGPPAPPRPKSDPDPFARAMPNAPAPVAEAPAAPVAPAAAAPTPAPSGDGRSTAEELSKLAKLHKSGALTDEEFSAAKAALLR
ncbi:MAG: 2TM domain-containing protein [Solirubrobacteraceae bacterium]|nr:2TM domain-containing protein [Solirubrobacteraceae bacterium]